MFGIMSTVFLIFKWRLDMRKLSFVVILGVLLVSLAGCATQAHLSGMGKEGAPKTIYVFNREQDAFAAAHAALYGKVPNAPILDLTEGPIRGYSVTDVNFVDGETTYFVRIFPATGRTADGREIFGYYAEVSVGSDFLLSSLRTKELYNDIVKKFTELGQAVTVDTLYRSEYKTDRMGWHLSSSPSVQTNAADTSGSAADEIAKLDKLRKSGAITNEEYEKAKSRLLGI